jgi:hypothetical protein
MASEKKRRKQSSIDRRRREAAGQKRPPRDGDRRHRGSDVARLAQERKQAAQRWNLDVGWTDVIEEPK